MKYTRSNLKKLEDLCQTLGYKVRYEQGHFQAGYCRVDAKQIVVLNKFYDVEGRINVLVDLIPSLPYDEMNIDDVDRQLYKKIVELRPVQA